MPGSRDSIATRVGAFASHRNRRGSRRHVQLGENGRHVVLDCLRGQEKSFRNRAVMQTFGELRQNLDFALGEAVRVASRGGYGAPGYAADTSRPHVSA